MSHDQREDLHAAGMLPKLQERADHNATLASMQQTARERLAAGTFQIQPPRFAIGTPVTINAVVEGVQYSADKVRYVFDLGEQLSIVDSDHVSPAVQQEGIGAA